jgi:hypothetical protein
VHAQDLKIGLDKRQHFVNGKIANRSEPFRFRLAAPARSISFRKHPAHMLQVVTGIKPLRDRADRLAQCLQVTQIGGARESIDLSPRVVDVVLARDYVTACFQDRGEHIPEHRATDVTQMQRSGRIGGDVFDIDGSTSADFGTAPIGASTQQICQTRVPECVGQTQIDEARTSDLGGGDIAVLAQPLSNEFS